MDPTDPSGRAAPQGDLFAGAPAPPRRAAMDFPAEARARLTKILAEARAAAALPWSERDLAMWEKLFPQMAGWLPEEEAARLRLAFVRELERLKAQGQSR
ncbi:MAG: hypothetical protein QOI38_2733 [Sphingomonadales bacterium]|nr:hypothetical protein [Sphingomonadales bacterium]